MDANAGEVLEAEKSSTRRPSPAFREGRHVLPYGSREMLTGQVLVLFLTSCYLVRNKTKPALFVWLSAQVVRHFVCGAFMTFTVGVSAQCPSWYC